MPRFGDAQQLFRAALKANIHQPPERLFREAFQWLPIATRRKAIGGPWRRDRFYHKSRCAKGFACNGARASSRIERRLAAILCADVAGYSRLMHDDEEATHTRLSALLADAVDPAIVEHGGRIVKNTGDGFLAEFPSAVERAAWQFQSRIYELTVDDAEGRRILFRWASISAMSLLNRTTFLATTLMSRRGLRASQNRAASASRLPPAIR